MLAKLYLVLLALIVGAIALTAPAQLDQPPRAVASELSPGPWSSRLYLAAPTTSTTSTTSTTQPTRATVEAQGVVTSTVAPPPPTLYRRFERLADCETGKRYQDAQRRWHFVEGTANWGTNTGNGYTGGLQFMDSTWHKAGGTGSAYQHPKDTQIAVASSWLARTSWAQWPWCSRQLGYR